jgi:Fe2+ transport system protein FeoA
MVGGEGVLRCRLLDMGLIPKTTVRVCHVAPLGDPIEIRIRDYTLTLRREDADKIDVVQTAAEAPAGTASGTEADI